MTARTKPKITWHREDDGSWTAHYGMKGHLIQLVHYNKALGKWWVVGRRSEDYAACDPYFMKHCTDQWGMADVKVEVAKVLDGRLNELRTLLPWLALLEHLKG